MGVKHVIDAHALAWHLEGNAKLGAKAKLVLADSNSELVLPIIALAEACWVVDAGKSSIASVAQLQAAVDADPRVLVAPLDRGILDRSQGLKAISEMHDRLIVATALHLQDAGETVHLLTKDPEITKSGLVSVVW